MNATLTPPTTGYDPAMENFNRPAEERRVSTWTHADSLAFLAGKPAPAPAVVPDAPNTSDKDVPQPEAFSGAGAAWEFAESFRHSGWAHDRKRVADAMATIPELSPRRLTAFKTCGCDAYVEACAIGHDHPKAEYRIRATKCHDRFCVPCATERARIIQAAILAHILPLKNLSLITLTLRASDAPLTETIDRLGACFRKLRLTPLWKKHVKGGVAIIEYKIGQGSGDWHTHLHMICEASYIPQAALSDLWVKITGDSFKVDVRRVASKNSAIRYVTKYVTKGLAPNVLRNPDKLAEAITANQGRRLVSTFGTWRGLKLTERPDHDQDYAFYAIPWHSIGSLHEVSLRAAAGDTDSQRIIRTLRTPIIHDDS